MAARIATHFARLLTTFGCVALTVACQRGPTAPAEPQSHIQGQVTDALLRGVAGATVEVLDGPAAGKKTSSGPDGMFTLIAPVAAGSPVRLRASKDGHQPMTAAATWQSLTTGGGLTLRLPGFDSSDALEAGEYSVTIGIDLATARSRLVAAPCPDFPVELATRAYDARIMEGPAGMRHVNLAGPTVVHSVTFQMFIADDQVVFDAGDDGISEDLPGFRYLTVWAGALPSDPRQITRGSSISIPVSGEFRYCQLRSPRGIYNECSQVPREQILQYHSCTSDRLMMTFTRR